MEKLLTMEQILKFVDNASTSTRFREAEEILSSKLVMCGFKAEEDMNENELDDDNRLYIVALCIRSGTAKRCTYEVNCKLLKNENEWTIEDIVCTCKRKSCKHCIAVLLYCNSNDITMTFDEIIRSRDPEHLEFFDKIPVVPISEMFREKRPTPPQLSKGEKVKIRGDDSSDDDFTDYADDRHGAGYRSWKENVKERGRKLGKWSKREAESRDKTLLKLLEACPDSPLARTLLPGLKKKAEQSNQAGSSKR